MLPVEPERKFELDPILSNVDAHNRERERIRREVELAKRRAFKTLRESYDLLDRVRELLEKRPPF